MKIDQSSFLKVLELTPLVSIDLIIQDSSQQVLLGRRNNQPAQGYWFVPGGRILKNETIASAVKRISTSELGVLIRLDQLVLQGAYDHIYEDNSFDIPGVNTHYVVLAYRISMPDDVSVVNDGQHSAFKWWPVEDLLTDSHVHENTRAYFV